MTTLSLSGERMWPQLFAGRHGCGGSHSYRTMCSLLVGLFQKLIPQICLSCSVPSSYMHRRTGRALSESARALEEESITMLLPSPSPATVRNVCTAASSSFSFSFSSSSSISSPSRFCLTKSPTTLHRHPLSLLYLASKESVHKHLLSRFPSLSAAAAARAGGGRVLGGRFGTIVSMDAATATDVVEVLVKAAIEDPNRLGDCPFSQRVLLTLEEKGIPYDAKLVDLNNKPAWFLEANPEGKVPVIKDDGKWVADSDVITALLEEKYPEPTLVTSPDNASIGSKIFPSFVKFLKSKDPSDGSEQALLSELKALDEHLQKNGPYVDGDRVSAVDLSLAPKLYHLEVALQHYKGWTVPSDFVALQAYTKALFNRESFLKTKSSADDVIRGWAKHVT